MKTGKKILIAAICTALVIAGIVGYKIYNDSKIVVNVSSVQMMNGGYFEDPLTTSGMVFDMENQTVDVDYQKVIKDVFVEEGQEVKEGDPLVEYDITSLQLSLELKKLTIESLQNEIEKAQRDLRKLRNTTPVPEYNPDPQPVPVPTPLPEKTPKQIKDAWDFLNSVKQAVNYVKESAAHVTINHMAPWKEENPEPADPGNEDPEPKEEEEPADPEVTTYHLSLTNCSTIVTYTDDEGEHEMEVAEYDFEPGTEIVVRYAQDQENDEFAYWKILNLNYQNSAYAEITFNMPEHDVNIVAIYDRYYKVNVENGTADQEKVFAGTTVTVTYTGEDQFKEWSSADEDVSFAYAKNQQTTFVMPEHDVNIKAKTDKDDKDPEPTPTPEPDKPGTEKNPYKFLIQENGYVTGSFLNELREMGEDVYAEIYTSEDNQWTGKLTRVAKLCSSSLVQVDDESMWSIPDRMVHFDEEDTFDIDDGGYTEISIPESGYTARELQRAIGVAERQLISLDLSKRKAELELKELEEQLSDGIVRAKRNGVVKTVHTPDDIPNDGTPFLEVVSGNGIYIEGSISELLLDKVKPGQAVYAMSWEDGNNYAGEIVSIDDWPSTNNMYWGGGNPNVSYYSFRAYIEDAGNLRSGNYLQLNFGDTPGAGNQIIISNAYVRDEKGKKYVMKDVNGKLAKQYVKTGKTYWGTMVEILEGVTLEDYLAFPYGDGAKEGAKTKQDEMGVYY